MGWLWQHIGQIPDIVGVAITGWFVEVTGIYSAAFVLAAAVSVLGALLIGCLFNARRLSEARLPMPPVVAG